MNRFSAFIFVFCLCIIFNSKPLFSQIKYPYPLKQFSLLIENKKVNMAYMDVRPMRPNGKNVLLLHGKNFNGFYWKEVIALLADSGYRVIIPDQVGWGSSDHPDIHYSFHLLATNTKALIDSLQIQHLIVIGHSMGGMLATRFSLMFPEKVTQLILEDPIGLEDYRLFIPYQSTMTLFEKELKATPESYKKYQESYYPVWKSTYEPYVLAQAQDLMKDNFKEIAWSNALTFQMIYEQPICYEWGKIDLPTLLIVGELDRTVVGKDLLPVEKKAGYGQYPDLGKKTTALLPHGELVILPGMGHIPHIQDFDLFKSILFKYIR
jgi:pimeloyl-ACP methyl ester carboxylesterase